MKAEKQRKYKKNVPSGVERGAGGGGGGLVLSITGSTFFSQTMRSKKARVGLHHWNQKTLVNKAMVEKFDVGPNSGCKGLGVGMAGTSFFPNDA